MAAMHEFFVTSDLATTQRMTDDLLTNVGYRIETRADGVQVAVRGSRGMTIAFGALAGKKFYRSFPLTYLSADPHVVVRIEAQSAGGKLLGGATGVGISENSLNDVAKALGEGFSSAGVFSHSNHA